MKLIYIFIFVILLSCSNSNSSENKKDDTAKFETGTVTDIDGNIYKTVKIGNQWWMAENLRVRHFNNGKAIRNYKDNSEWSGQGTFSLGALSYLGNDSLNLKKFGYLYNFYAVSNRQLAPKGWHIPTDKEWQELEKNLGMNQNSRNSENSNPTINRGSGEGDILKENDTKLWPDKNDKLSNKVGFSAKPGGFRHDQGTYVLGGGAHFWTSTNKENTKAWYRSIYSGYSHIQRYYVDKRYGFSVRCVKNDNSNTKPTASFTISPTTGTDSILYQFDASACNDVEDLSSELEVRWDFNNDNIWDTGYSKSKKIEYKFKSEGLKKIKLEVKDSGGLTDTIINELVIINQKVGSVTDIDGNVYKTIKIGKQWWMVENLRVSRFSNGDSIAKIKENNLWSRSTNPAYTTYNNDTSGISDFGNLYNGFAISDTRNLAPAGWRIPSNADWHELANYLGGLSLAGGKLKTKGTIYWNAPNTDASNSSEFNAKAAGARLENGTFNYKRDNAFFWSSGKVGNNNRFWAFYLDKHSGTLNRNSYSWSNGMSIRCVKN